MLNTLNPAPVDPIAGRAALTEKDKSVYVTTGQSGLIFYFTENMLDCVNLHFGERVSLTRIADNKCQITPARNELRNYQISRQDGKFPFMVNFPHHAFNFFAREIRHSQTACNYYRATDGAGFVVSLPSMVLLPEHVAKESKLETPQWLVDKVLQSVEDSLLWSELERRN